MRSARGLRADSHVVRRTRRRSRRGRSEQEEGEVAATPPTNNRDLVLFVRPGNHPSGEVRLRVFTAVRGKMWWTVASYGSVQLRLTDDTTVTVERDDLRRVYEELWARADTPGAVFTASLRLDEGGKHRRYPGAVSLDQSQSNALKRVLDRLAEK